GRMNRFSSCLSLISACFSEASPWITLTKSYTTRRSQPMIKSRLRRPTSKSMTAVLKPRMARPEEKLALVVVLPTPPLPEVTTTIRVMMFSLMRIGFPVPSSFALSLSKGGAESGASTSSARTAGDVSFCGECRHVEPGLGVRLAGVGNQADLHGLAGEFAESLRRLEGAIDAADGHQFGLEAGGEDARLLIALRACQRAAAQRRVDVDVAVGNHLGAGADHGQHDEIASSGVNALTRTQGLVDDHGCSRRQWRWRRNGCWRCGRLLLHHGSGSDRGHDFFEDRDFFSGLGCRARHRRRI